MQKASFLFQMKYVCLPLDSFNGLVTTMDLSIYEPSIGQSTQASLLSLRLFQHPGYTLQFCDFHTNQGHGICLHSICSAYSADSLDK